MIGFSRETLPPKNTRAKVLNYLHLRKRRRQIFHASLSIINIIRLFFQFSRLIDHSPGPPSLHDRHTISLIRLISLCPIVLIAPISGAATPAQDSAKPNILFLFLLNTLLTQRPFLRPSRTFVRFSQQYCTPPTHFYNLVKLFSQNIRTIIQFLTSRPIFSTDQTAMLILHIHKIYTIQF